MTNWTFLTNHSHVLLALSRDPELRIRDVAAQVGITERAAQRIVADLVREGFLSASREGRRNRYTIQGNLPFRHALEREHTVSEMLELFAPKDRLEANATK